VRDGARRTLNSERLSIRRYCRNTNRHRQKTKVAAPYPRHFVSSPSPLGPLTLTVPLAGPTFPPKKLFRIMSSVYA